MLFAIRSHRSHKKGCSSLPRICVRFIFERCTCDLNVCSQMWQWIKIWWRVGKVHGFLNVIINTGFHDHGALCNSLVSLHLWAYWGHSIGGIRGKLALVLHSSIKLAQKKKSTVYLLPYFLYTQHYSMGILLSNIHTIFPSSHRFLFTGCGKRAALSFLLWILKSSRDGAWTWESERV